MCFFLFPRFIWINNVKGDLSLIAWALNNCSQPFWLKGGCWNIFPIWTLVNNICIRFQMFSVSFSM